MSWAAQHVIRVPNIWFASIFSLDHTLSWCPSRNADHAVRILMLVHQVGRTPSACEITITIFMNVSKVAQSQSNFEKSQQHMLDNRNFFNIEFK